MLRLSTSGVISGSEFCLVGNIYVITVFDIFDIYFNSNKNNLRDLKLTLIYKLSFLNEVTFSIHSVNF